jgi:hypothetical protein
MVAAFPGHNSKSFVFMLDTIMRLLVRVCNPRFITAFSKRSQPSDPVELCERQHALKQCRPSWISDRWMDRKLFKGNVPTVAVKSWISALVRVLSRSVKLKSTGDRSFHCLFTRYSPDITNFRFVATQVTGSTYMYNNMFRHRNTNESLRIASRTGFLEPHHLNPFKHTRNGMYHLI